MSGDGPRLGPLVLLLPVLSFALAFLWLSGRMRPDAGRATPPTARQSVDAPVWSGSAELLGTRWAAQLERLHAGGEDEASDGPGRRQRFDARALRERLDLAAGEPWRLVLRRVADATAEPETLGGPYTVTVDVARVLDDAGPAQRTLERAAPDAAGLADPLRTLLAPPAEPWILSGPAGGGHELELLLWGRAPTAGATLLGFEIADPNGRRAALAIDLERRVARVAADRALARLERIVRDVPDGPSDAMGADAPGPESMEPEATKEEDR